MAGNNLPTPLNISALAREHGVSRRTIRRRMQKGLALPAPTPPSPAQPVTVEAFQVAQPSRLGAILVLVAFSVAALGVAINIQTGWHFGSTTPASMTFAGLSVAADVLAITLPSAAVALWHRAHQGLAAGAWCTWALALTLAGLASVGFVNLHVGDTAATRYATITTATALLSQHADAVAAAKQAAAAASESRQAECQVRGPRCRALEQEEQTKLEQLSAALATPLPAIATMSDADPQLTGALRLATWAGLEVTATDLGNVRLLLMALLPNLAGLIVCFGLALQRRIP